MIKVHKILFFGCFIIIILELLHLLQVYASSTKWNDKNVTFQNSDKKVASSKKRILLTAILHFMTFATKILGNI